MFGDFEDDEGVDADGFEGASEGTGGRLVLFLCIS